MKKITIIEDDITIREELKEFLSKYGYEAVIIEDFNNVLEDLKRVNSELILLDLNLPVVDGYYICREIRKTSSVPIIVVTSRDSDMDELMSINLGADDFITKPYNTQILLARIESLMKRVYGSDTNESIIKYKDLTLDLSKASISFKGNSLELTKNELKMLGLLMKNQGEIVSREDIMEYLWQGECFVDDTTLSVNITRLRKKIGSLGMENVIETRRGLGYIMP